MSDCLHCDIHELLESRLQDKETNLAEIAAKVTEVLADLILMAPPDDQSKLMADILANLGSFVLEKKGVSQASAVNGAAVICSQNVLSCSTCRLGALPAISAPLIAPIEIPATQSGCRLASASAA
jgi:hypothetical protein